MIQRLSKKRGEEGFTLIELLVVIIILGILAAVVVFAVGGITDKGQTDACAVDARTIRTAQEAHFAQLGAYANEADLVPKYLAQESTLYNTAKSGTTYTVTAVAGGPCATTTTTA